MQGITTVIHGKMHTKDSIRKMMQNVRNENRSAPPTSADRASVDIPEEYQIYQFYHENQERFLISDSGTGNQNCILIFGRESHVNWVNRMQTL
ncbi:hypothetical protein MXB_639, partial [Myxobolus squamalis]